MIRGPKSGALHRALRILAWIFLGLQVLLAALDVAAKKWKAPEGGDDTSAFEQAGWGILEWTQDWSAPLHVTFAICIAISLAGLKAIGKPIAWMVIQELLDEVRMEVFVEREEDEPEHLHRVTLFKRGYAIWRFWPRWGACWLRPVSRSGRNFQASDTCFLARDDSPTRNQGIAGLAYSLPGSGAISIPQPSKEPLPHFGSPGKISDEDVARYAEKTCVSKKWVRGRMGREDCMLARSFYASPVTVNSSHWGVVVIDSMDDRIDSKMAMEALHKVCQRLDDVLRVA